MKIVITGSEGFVAKNLFLKLKNNKKLNIFLISRKTPKYKILRYCKNCNFIFHLAGANRPKKKIKFKLDNIDYTNFILEGLKNNTNKPIIFYSSSIKVNDKTVYGKSKKETEKNIINFCKNRNLKYYILRFPNIYGKWAKPYYNSFLSTIFYEITRDRKIKNISKSKKIPIIYIDDLITELEKLLFSKKKSFIKNVKGNKYTIFLLYKKIFDMWENWKINKVKNTSTSLDRKLFSTMISYIPKKKFFIPLNQNIDERGNFSEFLKTEKSGQFSFFTINPNKSRGRHYHNSKNERFLLLSGKVNLELINMKNLNKIKKTISSKKPVIFTSVPGWKHTFINNGKERAIVIVWANEIFNPKKADTYNI